MAVAGFLVTLLIGFAVIPKDSAHYWFGGVFAKGGRTGFTGWLGNQSLDGLFTRLAGSINAARPLWLAASVIAVVAGMVAAKLLYDKDYKLPAVLLTALTGDLVSPISWDHHWVWVAPAAVALGCYAVRAWHRRARQQAALLGTAGIALLGIFAAWPGALWGERMIAGKQFSFFLGIIWDPPNSNPFTTYYKYGDKPWYAEYHWHGLQLITGNAYILAGMAAFGALVLTALLLPRRRDVQAE
jgi:alpha-1,2-mannosyltransferase